MVGLAVSFLFRCGTRYRSSIFVHSFLTFFAFHKISCCSEMWSQQMMLSWIGNQVVVLRVRSAIHIGTVTSIFGTCLMEHWDLVQNCWVKCSSSTCSDLRSSWENICKGWEPAWCTTSFLFMIHVFPVLIAVFLSSGSSVMYSITDSCVRSLKFAWVEALTCLEALQKSKTCR